VHAAAWQHFDHDADIGVRGCGRDVAEAFVQMATGMMAIVTHAKVDSEICVEIDCTAPDLELLLVDWLNSLIYEMAIRRMLFGRFDVDVNVEDCKLRARAWGEAVEPLRHKPAVEIKGATLTGLAVEQDPAGIWRASCVVDV
jgi:SHS2 domain-containing protein